MRSFIVDANVIFSAVISGKEVYVDAFTANSIFIPDFALDELQKYQTLLLEKTKLTPGQLRNFSLRLFSKLTVVPNFLISTSNYLHAFNLCKDIDENDTPYLALAIEFDLDLISKDEQLVQGLRQKGYLKVLSLQEFVTQFLLSKVN